MDHQAVKITFRQRATIPLAIFLLLAVVGCSPPKGAGRECGDYQEFGVGTWPDQCWRPYANSSVFNRTVYNSVKKFHPRSQQIIDRILSKPGAPFPIAQEKHPNHLVTSPTGYAGEPTYWARSSDPVFTLDCVEFGGACSIDGLQIHIPAGAQVEGNVPADPALPWPQRRDAHLTVMDQAKNVEYDLWQVQTSPLPASGGILKLSWGGYTKIDGNGLAEPDPNTGRTGQGTAAHFGDLAGRIRAEELDRSHPEHALFIVVNCDSGTFVYPAQGLGRPCSEVFGGDPAANVDAPPMGARLWLDMDSLSIQNLPIAAWKKKILLAMNIYGAFIGDTGAKGYFAIETESGNQYTSFNSPSRTYEDPWLRFGKANWEPYDPPEGPPRVYVGKLYGDKDANGNPFDWDGMVWSNLKVLDECVSRENCKP